MPKHFIYKYMIRLLIIGTTMLAILILNSCKVANVVSNQEAVERVSTFWGKGKGNDTNNLVVSEKAWFQDSIGITQICTIFTEETDNKQISTVKPLKYRFVDLRKKWAYEYKSFTDTAAIMRKFQTETAYYSGGWNFSNRTPYPIDSLQLLSDTTINAVIYKRCKVTYIFNQNRFDGIGLLRCDKKGTNFQIDTAISNRIGCPLVFFRSYPRNNPNGGLDLEIKFISKDFPDSVTKVFKAWKKNEGVYPVQ